MQHISHVTDDLAASFVGWQPKQLEKRFTLVSDKGGKDVHGVNLILF